MTILVAYHETKPCFRSKRSFSLAGNRRCVRSTGRFWRTIGLSRGRRIPAGWRNFMGLSRVQYEVTVSVHEDRDIQTLDQGRFWRLATFLDWSIAQYRLRDVARSLACLLTNKQMCHNDVCSLTVGYLKIKRNKTTILLPITLQHNNITIIMHRHSAFRH